MFLLKLLLGLNGIGFDGFPNPSEGEMSTTIHHAIDNSISTIAFGIL